MLKKLSKKKKIMFGVGLVVIICFISASVVLGSKNKASAIPPQLTDLKKTDISNYVNVSGTVKSSQTENVYTTLSYKIKKVNVKLGDTVKAGDVLAELDTDSLQKDVQIAEETNKVSNLTTQLDLQAKRRNYENSKYLFDNGMNSEILASKNALEQAEIDIKTKQDAYDYAKFQYENGDLSEQEMKTAENNLITAKSTLLKAKAAIKSTEKSVMADLKRAESDLKNAEASASSQASKLTLEKQRKALKDGKVIAPIDGTITLVNATVGNTSTGILFVVERPDQLEISTQVKEVDVAKIQPNQSVEIKSDSTGDKVIKGMVVSIAPAAKKGTSGETVTSSDVTFEAKVKVLEVNTGLRIGVNARLSVILEEKKGVFAIPYEAIMENTPGKKTIFVVEGKGKTGVVKEIPVTTGMETDFYTEISGKDLKEGMKIITNTADFLSLIHI